MHIESELYSALLEVGVAKERAERVTDALAKSTAQHYANHAVAMASKADVAALRTDIETLRADVFKALNDQTWKLAGIVLAGMGFVVAALKLLP
jgi:hypothetical protein